MSGRWRVVCACAMLMLSPQASLAGEMHGKLERIDLQTVTLRGINNEPQILQVDGKDREKAAPYIGKTVTVGIQEEEGLRKAISFRSSQ